MYAVYCCCSKVNWCKPVNGRHAFPRSLAAPQRILAELTLAGQPSFPEEAAEPGHKKSQQHTPSLRILHQVPAPYHKSSNHVNHYLS